MLHVPAGYLPAGGAQQAANAAVGGRVYRLLTRLTAVGTDWVEIERPLTANVRLAWAPRIHDHTPQISKCGIENLTIRFKWAPYKGHLLVSKARGLHGLLPFRTC